MKPHVVLSILILSSAVHADIPDRVLRWQQFTCGMFTDSTTSVAVYNQPDSLIPADTQVYGMLDRGEIVNINSRFAVDGTQGITIASIEPIADGGCILSVSDSDTAELRVYRLDGNGQVLWSRVIEQDAGVTAELTDIMELEDGGFLCIGTVTQSSTLQYRGLLVSIDSSGEELWRRVDWYQDHTSFQSAAILPDGNYLVLGWTAVESDFGVLDSDVLLVEIDCSGSTATGMQVEYPGNQKPLFMLCQDGNEITVAGENTAPGESLSTVFLAHTCI